MKVCHVTSAHTPEDGRIFRRACMASANAGYDTYLVEQGDTYEKQNVKIIGLGIPEKAGRLYRMTRFARKAYKKAVEVDADLYQLHDPELLPYAKKLKRKGKAVVFDSHENYVEQFRSKPYLPKPLTGLLSKWFLLYSHAVYGVIDGLTYPGNDDYKTECEKYCKRVAVTDNLPWLSEFYDKYDFNAEREPNTVCYVGGLDEGRGITQLVKACGKAECKLYLAGKFSSERYRLYLEGLDEYKHVEYLGILDRESIVQLLQKTSLGACTLLDVGQYYKMSNLPTKVYEYMSMGMPVLLNDSSYNMKINKELNIGRCVDPMNIEMMSATIRDLLDDSRLRMEMGENGRREIKNKFCWDREQENLIAMYKEILGE